MDRRHMAEVKYFKGIIFLMIQGLILLAPLGTKLGKLREITYMQTEMENTHEKSTNIRKGEK